MSSRAIEIAGFLEQQGWGESIAEPFEGDFSSRRYARLRRGQESAVLMDADANQNTEKFVALARLLHEIGIPAPKIYAAQPESGLVLLEDFGNRNVGSHIDSGSAIEPLFLKAAEIIGFLHRKFERTQTENLGLPLFNTELLVSQAELFLDAYVPFAKGREAGTEERQDFRAAWRAALRPIEVMPKSLILRDFMPDNLMERQDGSLGVIDFQDGGIGPIAYDLASLCEEVRRDGAFVLLPKVVARYRETAQSALTQADLMRACTILSAQRHVRILGVVARLAISTGRREKLDYIPRIKRHLEKILNETYLLPVKEWMNRFEGII